MPFIVECGCEYCGHEWESWLASSGEDLGGCPECGSLKVYRIPGGTLARCNDPAVRSEVLKKRSQDHSAKHFKENADRVISKLKK
jgi:predicted  nucleic acid-binding Zn-ribbon protein